MKCFLLEVALGILVLQAPISCAEDVGDTPIGLLSSPPSKGGKVLENLHQKEELHNTPSLNDQAANKNSYTINFNNISIIEYIRFVSKISNLNFVFNEADLQFNVTIVSEDPVTPRNIMSILIQILRIHNLVVLEQDNNLLITNARNVNQIATIVSSDLPDDHTGNAPVVTRVFRIRNANLGTLAAVIRPMLSDSSLLEVSNETRQLIITDITTNVDKVSALLASIDVPHTSLEIDSFEAQNADPIALITIATQIIAPFSEGNPIVFVPHTGTKTIFIVSTPYLIERAITIFEDLDVATTQTSEQMRLASEQKVYLYKIQYKHADELMTALQQVADDLKDRNGSTSLIDALKQAKLVKDSNSIIFVSSDDTLNKIKEILPTLDTPVTEKPRPGMSNFYVYKIENAPEDQFQNLIDQMADNLEKAPRPDTTLIDSLRSRKFISETHSLIFTGDDAAIKRISEVLPSLDVATAAPKKAAPSNFYVYKIENAPEDQLENSIDQMATNLGKAPRPDTNLIDALNSKKFIKETNSLIFTGDDASLKRISEVLPTLDVAAAVKASPSNFYVYKIQNAQEPQLENSIDQMTSNLAKAPRPDTNLIDALNSRKYIKETNSLIFTGDNASLQRISEVLPSLDVAGAVKAAPSNFYVYKIQNAQEPQLENSIDQMTSNLAKAPRPDESLINALSSRKYIKETNSLIFTGDDASLKRVSEILPSFDVSTAPPASPLASNFFIYNPKYRSGDELQKSVSEIAANLKNSGLADPPFLQTVNSMKWVPSTNSLIFTGDQASLHRIESIVASLDVARAPREAGEVFLYKPKHVSKTQLQDALTQLSKNLDSTNPSDAKLQDAINSAKWVADTQSFLFHADAPTILRLQDLLNALDSPEGLTGGGAHTFYLYKLQMASGDAVLTNLQRVAKNLEDSGLPNQPLIDTLETTKWMKDNNSLLLTGSSSAIDQAKKVIEQFDVVGQPITPPVTANKSSFFIYQPVNQTPQAVQLALQDLGKDLETSGLIDPDLLLTLQTMRYVETSNSLIFTGSPDSIDKIKELISHVDVISPEQEHIQQLGQLTFLIYKVQYVPGTQLIGALKGLAGDLQRTGAIDQNVVDSINGLKWIKETNSILFTGSNSTLQQVELMIKKFDTPSLAPQPVVPGAPPPSNFVVYTPKNQPGEELIKILDEFEQNLIGAGVVDKNLFDTINNLKWVQRTCSLIVSGDTESITKVEDLLRRFDIATREPTATPPSIESIENTSFLIYKLQYHQGSEILSALKQITVEIIKSNASANQNLVNAINSLQWIKVTNSLLASGEQETLSKLRDLIQNIDVPLKQIFIEILVIETSLNNSQNFGVQWGGKFQYLNRVATGGGNFPLPSANSTSGAAGPSSQVSVVPGITAMNGTTGPTVANIPFTSGFDLGVLGDIIMHKGQSFISLGSLVNALQSDTDSTILLNPKIITQDNRTSTIFIGNNIPFLGSIVTSQSSTFSQSSNLEYRDIGFNLTITPTVGNSDVVTMDISNDISEVTNNPTIGSISNTTLTGIQTSHTSMTTRVHVPNKHFVVLSGMITDTKSRFKSSIPCLGGLPIIGAVFSENDRVYSKQNLIIFVRPQIVNTSEEYKEVTEHQEGLFKNMASMPVLKEEFDAGVDMVKTPEDE